MTCDDLDRITARLSWDVVSRSGITVNGMAVLVALDSLGGSSRRCHARNAMIAESAGISPRSVAPALARLERLGLIRVGQIRIGRGPDGEPATMRVIDFDLDGTTFDAVDAVDDGGGSFDLPDDDE